MNERKWTKGPWYADRVHVTAWDGRGVAGCGYRRSSDYNRADHAENMNNAHLIAAAPDLYEALEGAIKLLELHVCGASDVVESARAALAKARGEA